RRKRVCSVFGAASVYWLPFAEGQFDAAFVHGLVEHLREPSQALVEMKRVLRASGVLGGRSPDWAGPVLNPPSPLLEQGIHRFTELQISNGGNPFVGRTLKGHLRSSGFSNVSISACYEIYDDPPLFAEWLTSCLESKGDSELREHGQEVRTWS